jgi:hypothetical protein
MRRTNNIFKCPPYQGFPAVVDHADHNSRLALRLAPNRAKHVTDIGLLASTCGGGGKCRRAFEDTPSGAAAAAPLAGAKVSVITINGPSSDVVNLQESLRTDILEP